MDSLSSEGQSPTRVEKPSFGLGLRPYLLAGVPIAGVLGAVAAIVGLALSTVYIASAPLIFLVAGSVLTAMVGITFFLLLAALAITIGNTSKIPQWAKYVLLSVLAVLALAAIGFIATAAVGFATGITVGAGITGVLLAVGPAAIAALPFVAPLLLAGVVLVFGVIAIGMFIRALINLVVERRINLADSFKSEFSQAEDEKITHTETKGLTPGETLHLSSDRVSEKEGLETLTNLEQLEGEQPDLETSPSATQSINTETILRELVSNENNSQEEIAKKLKELSVLKEKNDLQLGASPEEQEKLKKEDEKFQQELSDNVMGIGMLEDDLIAEMEYDKNHSITSAQLSENNNNNDNAANLTEQEKKAQEEDDAPTPDGGNVTPHQ